MHEDSILNSLLHNEAWLSARFQAHSGIGDYSELLWPERFDEEFFKREYKSMLADGLEDEYAQEWLNIPIAPSSSPLQVDRINHISRQEFDKIDIVAYAAGDFAVSIKQKRDYTSMGVFGVDYEGNLYWFDHVFGRMEADTSIEEMFELHNNTAFEFIAMEKGPITAALTPIIYREQEAKGADFEVREIFFPGDKLVKSRPLQRLINSGKFFVVEGLPYYEDYVVPQLSTFPKGKHEDIVDMLSLMCKELANVTKGKSDEELGEEFMTQLEYIYSDYSGDGRDNITGY